MHIAPPLEHTMRFRHFSCPECKGALEQVREKTTGTLTFECRVGHRYGARELVVGKEIMLEQLLWASLTTMDELIVLLLQLQDEGEGQGEGDGARESAYGERAKAARALRAAIEGVIADNDPVRIDSDVPLQPDPKTRLGRGDR